MYLSLHQDSGIQNLIKSSDNETYTSHHDCKFICYRNTCHNTVRSVPKKNGNKYVLYEERTDNRGGLSPISSATSEWMFGKTDGKGTLFRSGVWHMEEIKGNPKSQEAYETSKQVYGKKNIMTLDDF